MQVEKWVCGEIKACNDIKEAQRKEICDEEWCDEESTPRVDGSLASKIVKAEK